jgi:hypothetical protein
MFIETHRISTGCFPRLPVEATASHPQELEATFVEALVVNQLISGAAILTRQATSL